MTFAIDLTFFNVTILTFPTPSPVRPERCGIGLFLTFLSIVILGFYWRGETKKMKRDWEHIIYYYTLVVHTGSTCTFFLGERGAMVAKHCCYYRQHPHMLDSLES
jgi:hypothetical protein